MLTLTLLQDSPAKAISRVATTAGSFVHPALPFTFKGEAMIQSARIRGVLALEKLEG